ncbi:MAG: hydroxyproline-2-epimerase, partial [Verrucomicrobia bacterium]|nr:hydroxyproline-2-epimerase [Verrucomicrobiota bacterium]
IGVIATLAFLGRIRPGTHRLDTPVGAVEASLSTDGRVSIRNVISYRYRKAVSVDVPGIGRVIGDIAWGGNWFFLVREPSFELNPNRVDELRSTTLRIRAALEQQGITGEGGGMIDHVELFGPPRESVNDSRNFVLCPGGAYDRSPCGTGTSAKLACLAADGQLAEGEIWRQESIVGSVFEGSYIVNERGILPTITGQAWVNSQSDLLLDPTDPFCWGMR